MKRVYGLILVVMMAMSACGSDDTPAVVEVDPEVVGVWKVSSIVATNCEDETNNDSQTNLICTSFNCTQFTFNDDGSYRGLVIVDSSGSEVFGTFTTTNGILTIVSGQETSMGSYTISNNVLTYEYEVGGCDVQLVMAKD